ncbi:hypothetical protein [Acetobacter fabarum]|uniref:hypothetical protein n=1 Tax=Acetobacter fabarum TaxID=483199 RepID=UPI0020A18178|nr:hypothetical protein [Acetobacter fabarum]MCP1233429.1 hypothetical protein [Acetobacter fabarum]
MTTPTNWPNPERPGVPMFPERSGRHHVGTHLPFWYSDIQQWLTMDPIRAWKEPEDFAGDEYHGPVLTPAQIAEMLAGERERCAKLCEDEYGKSGKDFEYLGCLSCAEAIRNLGDAP